MQIDPQSPQLVSFQVPPSHWDATLSAMLPARRDDHPLKWIGFGHLDLGLKSGAPLRIDLYDPTEDVGAFSADRHLKAGSTIGAATPTRCGETLAKAFKDSGEPAAKRVDAGKLVIHRGMRLDESAGSRPQAGPSSARRRFGTGSCRCHAGASRGAYLPDRRREIG